MIMTSRQKKFIEKYLSAIDKSSFIAIDNGEDVEVVDSDYVKSLIWDMMREYERANSFPSTDFWGQPI